jgi:DNA-binding response OmpR family regulator
MLITDDPADPALRPGGGRPVGATVGPGTGPDDAGRVVPKAPKVPKVLIVDADPRLRQTLGAALRGAGMAVRTAVDGLEGLYAVDRERPDVVVLDLELPVVSGFRLLHLLKRGGAGTAPLGAGEGPAGDGAGTPVLVLTALSWEEAWDAVCDGAEDIVTKPVAPPDLVACVQSLLDRREPAAPPAPAAITAA